MNESMLVKTLKILADQKGGSSLTRKTQTIRLKSLSKPFQRLHRVPRQPRSIRQQLRLCQT